MERNKWEEEFKEKLSQREITPAPHAWDRLDAMLNAADQTGKPKRNRTWLYIAASVAALILLATALVVKGSRQQQENGVATQESQKPQQQINPEVIPPMDTLPSGGRAQVAEREVLTPEPVNTQTEPNLPGSGKSYLERKSASQSNPVAANEANNKQVQPAPANGKDAIGDKPASGQTDGQIAAIDPQLKKPKAIKVDAKSLLSQVDGELEMTFREKALTTINKKYQDVKVALANRNNSKE